METVNISKTAWHYRLVSRYLIDGAFKRGIILHSADEQINQEYSTSCSYGLLLVRAIVDDIISVMLIGAITILSLLLVGITFSGFGTIVSTFIPMLVFTGNTTVMFVMNMIYGGVFIVGFFCAVWFLAKCVSSLKSQPKQKEPNVIVEFYKAKTGKFCKKLDFK